MEAACLVEVKLIYFSSLNMFCFLLFVCFGCRQKSSGAEGERLKEATNINKSLSTLG